MGAVIFNVFDIILFLLNLGLRIALTSLWVKTDEGVEQVLNYYYKVPECSGRVVGQLKKGPL